MSDDYISFVIVGSSTEHRAWHWNTWTRIASSLDPIVEATIEPVGVRSLQSFKGGNEQIGFGRLGWDSKSHQKWTHGSELNRGVGDLWQFIFTEVWSPRWAVCLREHRNPILFIRIENPFILSEPKAGQFNQFIQLSATVELFGRTEAATEAVLRKISSLLRGVLTIFRVSPWNVHGDCVQDVLNNHLRYVGMYDDIIPDLSKSSGGWEEYQGKAGGRGVNVRLEKP